MSGALVVVRPFGPHKVGDLITATASMRAALAGEHARDVVTIQFPVPTPPRAKES
jgi:hypothetical protein